MEFFFLHNHFIPPQLKDGPYYIKSVIVPEFYPDLNNLYLNDLCYFRSVESYIEYVVQKGYYSEDVPYAIENNKIINPDRLHETLFAYKKLGVKIIQLYCGKDNSFFCTSAGLTHYGEKLLFEICETGLILDLSHIPDELIVSIVSRYKGRMIVSHCACSELYAMRKSRSNSLTCDTLLKIAEHIEVFGIPFLNNIVATEENELCSEKIFEDVIAQTFFLTSVVGSDKVALAPDYLDTNYFSRRFGVELIFPDVLTKQEGLVAIGDRLSELLSADDVGKITAGNVRRLLYK